MPRVRVHNFAISLDGYGAAPDQSLDNPLGFQQYLRAGLIDDLHLAIDPILLGGGERLFDHLDGGRGGYECVEFVSSPAVAHVRLSRTTV